VDRLSLVLRLPGSPASLLSQFPSGGGGASSPLFDLAAVQAWLDKQRKGQAVSAEVSLWQVLLAASAPSGTWRIHLDDSPAGATSCAIALLPPGRDTLDLRREVRWFMAEPWSSNQQLIDQAYGFGFDWIPGAKPPL